MVLVRDVGTECDGVEDRQYAYVTEDWTLPAEFDGGARVPKRFHAQLAAFVKNNL
jgi:hypothetical protein